MPLLRTDNYIYFFTASGFFIGLAYSAWATNDAFDMLLYTFEITLFFYLFVHLVIINFVDVKNGAKAMFDYKQYEEVSEYFIQELHDREKKMGSLIEEVHEIDPIKEIMSKNGLTEKKAA